MGNRLAIIDISSICMGIASGDAGPGPGPRLGPGPTGPLASPEAMPMHIDDISTIASPFPKKVNPICTYPFKLVLIQVTQVLLVNDSGWLASANSPSEVQLITM